MIDLHSHVLPEIDDGSRSAKESLEMLRESARQGIGCIAATPHFYPMEETPEHFLSRRNAAAERLKRAWRPGLPELLLGAEVYFFEGMSMSRDLMALRLEGTQLLLVEMPVRPWTARMMSELLAVQARRGITVVMAHIERYFRFQSSDIWDGLLARGILMQCNAEFFISWKTRRKARQMLEDGRIHFLGSDSHNMSSRPPRLGEALAMLGESERRRLEQNIRQLVTGSGGTEA